MSSRFLFAVLSSVLAVSAIPQETASSTGFTVVASTTTPPTSTITSATPLTCTDGSTVLYTTECTMGYPISYCYSPPPPIQCPTGFFPGTWHPGHCITQSTCYPTDAVWLTSECSNGAIAAGTSTLYAGTLADGSSTIIKDVSCTCAANQYYSWGAVTTGTITTEEVFCMPYSECASGMTTSISTNGYCASTPASCPGRPTTTPYCKCANPTQTPVYPPGGSVPTGCA